MVFFTGFSWLNNIWKILYEFSYILNILMKLSEQLESKLLFFNWIIWTIKSLCTIFISILYVSLLNIFTELSVDDDTNLESFNIIKWYTNLSGILKLFLIDNFVSI